MKVKVSSDDNSVSTTVTKKLNRFSNSIRNILKNLEIHDRKKCDQKGHPNSLLQGLFFFKICEVSKDELCVLGTSKMSFI